ncbi:hypothetical protein Lal_00033428 [Lupinus albus]|nr:hypothetical protein Lal_00033428 [Lupinus albus]
MDELVSLRGYITTRMDAFDTRTNNSIMNFIAHNSKRKGEHTYRGSILKTSQDISSNRAPDLGTVLMKTPTSHKEERKKTYKDYRRQSFKI